MLKRLYYEAETKVYEYDQMLFEKGESCENIYIVLSGILAIELTDKLSRVQ